MRNGARLGGGPHMSHLQILIQSAKAMEAAEEAQAMVEAQFYGQASPMEATLALSVAKAEADRAMAQLAKHIVLLEQSADSIEKRQAA